MRFVQLGIHKYSHLYCAHLMMLYFFINKQTSDSEETQNECAEHFFFVVVVLRDELYKNWSSRKTDGQ